MPTISLFASEVKEEEFGCRPHRDILDHLQITDLHSGLRIQNLCGFSKHLSGFDVGFRGNDLGFG